MNKEKDACKNRTSFGSYTIRVRRFIPWYARKIIDPFAVYQSYARSEQPEHAAKMLLVDNQVYRETRLDALKDAAAAICKVCASPKLYAMPLVFSDGRWCHRYIIDVECDAGAIYDLIKKEMAPT